MSKESKPSNQEINQAPDNFYFMIDGSEFDETIKQITQLKKDLASSETDRDTIDIKSTLEFYSEITQEIETFIELAEDEKYKSLDPSRNTIILSEWKNKLQKLKDTLNKEVKTRKRKKTKAGDSGTPTIEQKTAVTEGKVDDKITPVEQKPDVVQTPVVHKKPEVTDLITKNKKERNNQNQMEKPTQTKQEELPATETATGFESNTTEKKVEKKPRVKKSKNKKTTPSETDTKSTSKETSSTETVTETTKPSAQDKLKSIEIKSFEDLPGGSPEVEPVRETGYESLISNFIDSSKNMDEYVLNRFTNLISLIKYLKELKEDKRDVEIASYENKIGELISKLESSSIDEEDKKYVLWLLNKDIEDIKSGVWSRTEGEKEIEESIRIKAKTREILSFTKNIKKVGISLFRRYMSGEKDSTSKDKIKDAVKAEIESYIKEKGDTLKSHIEYIVANGLGKKGGETKKLLGNILRFIEILSETVENPNQENISKFEKNIERAKKPEDKTKKEEKQEDTKDKEYLTHSILNDDEKKIFFNLIDVSDIHLLQENPKIESDLVAAIKEYDKTKQETVDKLDEVATKWEDFREQRKSYLASQKPEKTKRKSFNIATEEDIDVEKYTARAKRRPLTELIPDTSHPATESSPKGSETAADTSTETTPVTGESADGFEIKPLSIEEMIDTSGAKTEILEDKGFEKWFKYIYNSLKQRGENNEFEKRHIDDLHKDYIEVKPIFDKLIEISSDISKEGKIKSKLSEAKISELLFDLYRDFDGKKGAIETIIDSYEINKKNKEEIDRLNKIKKAKDDIREKRANGTKFEKELKTDQVKTMMEAIHGDTLIRENVSDMSDFLMDMFDNYKKYSTGIKEENESNSTASIVKKYVKSQKKGFWAQIKQRFSFENKMETIENINRFAPMIDILRKHNLIDRLGKNKDVINQENRIRMSAFLNFMRDNSEILYKHIQKPEDIDTAGWSEEDKKFLDIFKEVYKNFTESKYRDPEIRKRIEDSIEDQTTETREISRIHVEDTEDILFSFETDEDLKSLEKKALYETGVQEIEILDKELISYKDKKVDYNTIKKIASRYNEAKKNIEDSGFITDIDSIKLKKTELLLSNVITKSINANERNQLDNILSSCDAIISSTEETKENKLKLLDRLIKTLEMHRNKPDNTIFANMYLDDIIKKYKAIKNSL